MNRIAEIKDALADQRSAVAADRRTVAVCASCVARKLHKGITHPLTLATSFGAGWLTGHYAQRPRQVKQVKNVTIKRPSMTGQLIKMIAPYVISELQTGRIVENAQPEASPDS